MIMTVDQFLSRFYRASERRSSPRAASIEADHISGTYEQAVWAEEAYTWALCLMGTAALSDVEEAVLRSYYLWLTPAHIAIIERRFGGTSRGPIATSKVAPHSAPPEAADLQSYCDWPALAKSVGLTGRSAPRVAQRIWRTARERVASVIDARAEGAVG